MLPSAAARPAGRSASNRRRPERDGTDRSVSTPRPSPEEPPWLSAHTTPCPTRYARANGWDGTFETFDDLDLPTYVGPATFMNLPWMTDPDALRAAAVDVAIVGGAIRRRGDPPIRSAVRAARGRARRPLRVLRRRDRPRPARSVLHAARSGQVHARPGGVQRTRWG